VPDSLRDSITSYIDHLQDVAWIDSVVEQYGLAEVLAACARVLAEGEPSETHEVATFLRDIGIFGIAGDDLVTRVRKAMPRRILPRLRALLRSPVLQARMTAIYTIGKLTFRSEARALRAVFPLYLERDPFCLSRLLFELSWLGDKRGVRARLKQVIRHDSYLIRWSALGYLGCGGAERDFLDALSADSNPWIAAEAQHELDRATEPSITFDTLELRFMNELARRKQDDYRLAELDEFVRK
jgi:hypothetical protein